MQAAEEECACEVLTGPAARGYAPRMKTLTLDELQRDLPAALALVRAGETVTVTEGERGAPLVVLAPPPAAPAAPPAGKRRVGFLEGKAKATFHPDFKMTEEEFLNS